MKKWLVIIFVLISVIICFIPYERSITFTQTRTEQPVMYYLPLNDAFDFQIVFTHSIHLTDVIESYRVLTNNELQLLSMQYEDVAIGMPSSAEEGQTLTYEKGRYTLRYDDAKLKDFTLHVGDVDYKLNLQHKDEVIALKEKLTRGKSYVLKIKKLSFYQKMKGVELNESK
ncbi:DUF1850 domain-containing protein [Solibacillus daqui]|uniref:DUF1850 domain-containing protein n=1 Tax=Solibacillus daqui TaxID=2912187 RepID=UPI002365AEDB|nr:DUF1850 domain-containing protein [Solibacillus daqui]